MTFAVTETQPMYNPNRGFMHDFESPTSKMFYPLFGSVPYKAAISAIITALPIFIYGQSLYAAIISYIIAFECAVFWMNVGDMTDRDIDALIHRNRVHLGFSIRFRVISCIVPFSFVTTLLFIPGLFTFGYICWVYLNLLFAVIYHVLSMINKMVANVIGGIVVIRAQFILFSYFVPEFAQICWILSFITFPMGIAHQWWLDVPDKKGDKAFGRKTFVIEYGLNRVYQSSMFMCCVSLCLVFVFQYQMNHKQLLVIMVYICICAAQFFFNFQDPSPTRCKLGLYGVDYVMQIITFLVELFLQA
eukprot:259360_1